REGRDGQRRPQGKPARGRDSDQAQSGRGDGQRHDRKGKPGGPKSGGKPGGQGPKTFSSRPEKKADPDSPFAILAALKDRK
ncbi:hypothetical protein, partial [Paracoccus sp. (in: a-proteobacteria)]|uniref:hypothetical protein n=1 Tax=Paracoccus sp. TaxID=267 RepID=UPI00272AD566